jgi:DNA polymerase III delta prime subunit
MKINENENILWVEKYRPTYIDDCILPKSLKEVFRAYRDKQELQNMLLSGPPGIGKTTVAKALCLETDSPHIIINASESGNIDTLRTTIRDFASTVSFSGKRKVVILDEADYLNANSTQPALRGFMEEFSTNCAFFLTCNFKNKIITPLHGRTTVIDFRIDKKEKPDIAKQFFDRMIFILDNENIEYDVKVLEELVINFFPDFRRAINELQRYSQTGKIDSGILSSLSEIQIKSLIKHLKDKDWKGMRSWVVQNLDNDPTRIFRAIYDSMYDYVKPSSIPPLVLILNDGQRNHSFVADPEINMVSTLTQIMGEIEFK